MATTHEMAQAARLHWYVTADEVRREERRVKEAITRKKMQLLRCMADMLVLCEELHCAGDDGCSYDRLGEMVSVYEAALMDPRAPIQL